MPKYEAALIFKVLQRTQMVDAIKRSAQSILERGGYIRSLENLGQKRLPYKMSKEGVRYTQGSYLIVNFDSPSSILPDLKDDLMRDLDIIRPRILRREEEVGRPCQTGPCDFGELDKEMRQRVKRNLRDFVQKL